MRFPWLGRRSGVSAWNVTRFSLVHLLRISILALLLAASAIGIAQALPRETRIRILEAVVEVMPLGPDLEALGWSGSGTIVSPDGHILTNFHVIEDGNGNPMEWHAIFVTNPESPDLAPQHTYWARYIDGDPRHDIALIQIVEYVDETPIPMGTVFPSMPIGTASLLIPGDPITVVGFPGVSGATVTFTQGIVSGFVGEDLVSSGKQWIKTDAKLSKGNSGGGAFNEDGILVGIPTLGIQEDNDGRFEAQDYLRPIDLALPLLARHGVQAERIGGVSSVVTASPAANPARPNAPMGEGSASQPVQSGNGTRVDGSLALGDAQLESGEYWDVYVMEVTTNAVVRIEVTSNDIDPYLVVLNDAGVPILEVDDSEGRGLEISEAFEPPPGTYTLVVTSAWADEVGAYSLSVEGASLAQSTEGTLPSNEVMDLAAGDIEVLGELEPSDEAFDNGEFFDVITVEIMQGTNVRYVISSKVIDPLGVVIDPSQEIVLLVDDSEGADQPFGVDEVFEATVSGTYTFIVSSPFPNEIGEYQVQISSVGSSATRPSNTTMGGDARSGFVGTLALGQRMQNQLQAGDSGAAYHTYVIEVPPGLSTLTVVARGDADVDLFAKFGSDINGDADYSDITSSTSALISVANPQAGTWYFDVVWFSDAGLVSYVIETY